MFAYVSLFTYCVRDPLITYCLLQYAGFRQFFILRLYCSRFSDDILLWKFVIGNVSFEQF